MTEQQVTNRMRHSILTFLFLLLISIIVNTSLIGVVSAQTLVSISPSTQQIDEGQNFMISVYVEPDAPISGALFDLQFDSSLVNVVSITEGNLLNQDGASTIFSSGTIDNSQGIITDVYALILGKSNVTSSGIFANIDLVALNKSGTCTFEISNAVISNSAGQSLPITIINGDADIGDIINLTETPPAPPSELVSITGQQTTPIVWNESNFDGFKYNSSNIQSTETLTIAPYTLNGPNIDRVIEAGNLTYTTSFVLNEYPIYTDLGLYINDIDEGYSIGYLNGKQYVAIHNADKLATPLVEFDSNDVKTLRTGDVWDIGGGFSIIAHQIDADGNKVWFGLDKNGIILDDQILETGSNLQSRVWTYNEDVAGESDIPILSLYVSGIMRAEDTAYVQIKYLYLIDNNVLEVSSEDHFGNMEVTMTGGDSLGLSNLIDLDLTPGNSPSMIMENMSFITLDNLSSIEFYPSVVRNEIPILSGGGGFVSGNYSSLWDLSEGYTIALQEVDIEGDKAMFSLLKDGVIIDQKIMTERLGALNDLDSNYQYIKNGTQIINATLDFAFRGSNSKIANLINVYQLSEVDYGILLSNESHIFKSTTSTGMPWDLSEGYTLTMKDVSLDAEEVWFELSKNDVVVKDDILDEDTLNTSIYTSGNGSISYVVDSVFGGINESVVKISNVIQYSDISGELLINDFTHLYKTGNPDGIPWILPDGYLLSMKGVDRNSEKVWLELFKDGNSLKEDIVRSNALFTYVNGLESFNCLISGVMHGTLTDVAKITSVDLYSDAGVQLIHNGSRMYATSNPSGEIWQLSEGYSLDPKDVDVDGRKVWLSLSKEGTVVKDEIIDSLDTNAGRWFNYYNLNGELVFSTYVDAVFKGMVDYLVVLENSTQYSEINGTVLFSIPKTTLRTGIILNNDTTAPSITLSYPSSSSISNTEGDFATFTAIVDQVANVTWILDGNAIQTNTSVTIASYYNNSAQLGTHNLTVFAENANGTGQKKWTWIVGMLTPSESVENIVYIRGTIINGSDITNNDMGYIGNNGNGVLEINAFNFAGFYYDLNSNIGAEKFEILQNLTVPYRIIIENGLVYTTNIIDVDYEQMLWTDQYQKIGYFGKEYVPIKTNSANKLSKLLMDEKASHTIREGQSLELSEGYAIKPRIIDVDGNKVWLELTKNGEFVADKVIEVAYNGVTNTWSYNQDIGGETDVETFRINVDAVFQGQFDSLMVVEGIWQISDSILELDIGTTEGLMKVQEIDSKIKLVNNEFLTLSRGSTVDIAKNISIVVADSTTDVRFHLSKGYTTPGTYEVRGEVYNLSSGIYGIIDYNNFAGFYYDLDANIGTESLEMNSISGRTINANSLIYTTVPKVAEFEYASWGSYSITGLMGEEYFAGYPAGTFGSSSPISMMSNNQLSKVLIDEDNSRYIYSGSGLILEEGYTLNIVEIDKNESNVFVTLTKNGSELDSSIISSGSDYIYKKDLGSSDDVPIIAIHFKDIFQGTETNAVFVNGIFQISDEYITIHVGDSYGLMEISTVNANIIEMKNDDSFSLTQDSIISIMGDIKFKVADDSNDVRYYPFTEVIIESIPIESEPMSSVYDGSITEGDGYQINNYVIDVTDVFVSANTAVFKIYDEGFLKYDTMLGTNDSFSFDFEGSTVQLKLRSTISGVLPQASVLIETDYNISDLHTNGIVIGGHEYAIYTGDTPPESISIGSAVATLNSTVTIPVSLAYTENITGFSFDLLYNSSVATVSIVSANANFTGTSITPNIDNINGNTRVILTGSDFITVSSETPVLDITFNITGGFGSYTSLVLQNVEFSDSDFNPYVPDAIVNGSITVGIKGDFNNNGRVDIGDVAKVAFMVAGIVPEELSADFNDNGYVDIGDAAKIAFYLAGKVGEL